MHGRLVPKGYQRCCKAFKLIIYTAGDFINKFLLIGKYAVMHPVTIQIGDTKYKQENGRQKNGSYAHCCFGNN